MKRHNSQRGYFAYEFYKQLKKDHKIFLLVGDLGYGMWDQHFKDFPRQCFNVGAAEQTMMGMAVGLALEGKKPFVYSITTFLLYRPFEWLRLYLQHENIPVRLIASGRDKDYAHDGITHHSEDAKKILDTLPNIKQHWPDEKEEVTEILKNMINNDKPSFISLRR